MSARSSNHISEFFDDSDGHRFINYIRNRRGAAKRKFLFVDNENDQLSFNVQLEKLANPQLKDVAISQNKTPSSVAGEFEISVLADMQLKSAGTTQHRDVENTSPIRPSMSQSIREKGDPLSPYCELGKFSTENCSAKKLRGGMRTLLHEFRSNTEGATHFDPSVCSTPLPQAKQNVAKASLNTNPLAEAEHIDLNNANGSIVCNKSCDHDNTLMRTLQRQDAKSKGCMESIVDKTLKKLQNESKQVEQESTENTNVNMTESPTSSKRTFTVENTNVVGQFVFTSEPQNTRTPVLQQSATQKSNTNTNLPTGRYFRQSSEIRQYRKSNKENQKQKSLQNNQNENDETQNLPHNNSPIVFLTQNIEIPEIQSQANARDNMSSDEQTHLSTEQHVEAIPFKQTINTATTQKKDNRNSKFQHINCCHSMAQTEDNLKLMDLLTNDGEDTSCSNSEKAQHSSEMPLNLAPKSCNVQKKQKPDSCKGSEDPISEPEVAIPPPAHTIRLRGRKTDKLLNRPRETPLNGSVHRKSSTKILDLRKRKSRCHVSDNKSQCSAEKINKKQPLPDNIRESVAARGKEDILEDMGFIDETPFDRVTFKNKNKRSSPVNMTPEVLKNYLGISTRLSLEKQRNFKNSTSRRSLYTTHDEYNSKSNNSSITYLKSPPKSQCDLTKTLKVVSPPPTTANERKTTPTKKRDVVAITRGKKKCSPNEQSAHTVADIITTREIQNTGNEINVDVDENCLTLLPPPPGFESDSVVRRSNSSNHIARENRTQNESVKTNLSNNSDHLFVKPTQPAPKKKPKKVGHSIAEISHESTQDNRESTDSGADFTEGIPFRRSKRGQVPRIQLELFYMYHQQEIKRLERIKKQKELAKKRGKTKNEASNSGANSKSSKRKETSLPTVSENDALGDCGSQFAQSVKKAGRPKKKQKESELSKENVNCSRLIVDSEPEAAPSIDNANGSISSNFSSSSSNAEFISWLKNMNGSRNTDLQETYAPNGVKISSAANLSFTELQGVEYAYYNTVEKASLGYLRFKPFQIKQRKKARHFELHFINLTGLFQITVDDTETILNVGDVIAVGKLTYYDIRNLSADISILMVIKI